MACNGIILALIFGLVTGIAGFWMRENTRLTIVEISAWLTLGSGLILPMLATEGQTWALICTCVSYAAMSNGRRIRNYGEMLIVSIFCSITVYYGQGLLVGVGGRLGTFAALSVVFFNLIRTLLLRRRSCDQLNAKG